MIEIANLTQIAILIRIGDEVRITEPIQIAHLFLSLFYSCQYTCAMLNRASQDTYPSLHTNQLSFSFN